MDRDPMVYEPPAASPQSLTTHEVVTLMAGTTFAAVSTTVSQSGIEHYVFSGVGIGCIAAFLYMVFSRLIREVRNRRQ